MPCLFCPWQPLSFRFLQLFDRYSDPPLELKSVSVLKHPSVLMICLFLCNDCLYFIYAMYFLQHTTLIFLPNVRLVLEFDLLFFAFGKLGTVTWAWVLMFFYTLLVPYYTLVFWGSLYHSFPSKLGLSLGTGLILSAIQTFVLGLFPIYVVVDNQLPPASRFIVILEQVSVRACFRNKSFFFSV